MTPQEARKAADIICKAYDEGYDAGYAKAQARIKELEEAMRSCEFAMSNNRPQSKDGQEWEWGDVLTHARAILNKE